VATKAAFKLLKKAMDDSENYSYHFSSENEEEDSFDEPALRILAEV
jgi:hypothetical protein